MKPTGYIVMEYCEDYEQALVLVEAKGLPPGGILDWPADRLRSGRALFTIRADAVSAITRTEHYRLAYGKNIPEKKFCIVVPVCTIPSSKDSA